jgi:hypothetical protein
MNGSDGDRIHETRGNVLTRRGALGVLAGGCGPRLARGRRPAKTSSARPAAGKSSSKGRRNAAPDR